MPIPDGYLIVSHRYYIARIQSVDPAKLESRSRPGEFEDGLAVTLEQLVPPSNALRRLTFPRRISPQSKLGIWSNWWRESLRVDFATRANFLEGKIFLFYDREHVFDRINFTITLPYPLCEVTPEQVEKILVNRISLNDIDIERVKSTKSIGWLLDSIEAPETEDAETESGGGIADEIAEIAEQSGWKYDDMLVAVLTKPEFVKRDDIRSVVLNRDRLAENGFEVTDDGKVIRLPF